MSLLIKVLHSILFNENKFWLLKSLFWKCGQTLKEFCVFSVERKLSKSSLVRWVVKKEPFLKEFRVWKSRCQKKLLLQKVNLYNMYCRLIRIAEEKRNRRSQIQDKPSLLVPMPLAVCKRPPSIMKRERASFKSSTPQFRMITSKGPPFAQRLAGSSLLF